MKGHAFPGYWRSEESWLKFINMKSLDDMAMEELDKLVNRTRADLEGFPWVFRPADRDEIMHQVEQGNLVPLETVWLTARRGFWEAADEGWDNLLNPSEFDALVDITRAREDDVTPLPVGEAHHA